MKIAHLLVPDFPIQVELLGSPELRQRPVVIGGRPHEGGSVYACSPAARRNGVLNGMPLRQAEQLSPEALFLPTDAEGYRSAHRELLRCLEAFSPLRQTLSPGQVCLEASGLEGLYGPDRKLAERLCFDIRERCGLLAKVGLAANRFTAATAAGLAALGGSVVVPAGDEAAFLSPLEIVVLLASEQAAVLLARLGLLTVGQVADLPAGALARTLGREGHRLHQLARGIDPTPLIPEFEQAPLSARVMLDWQLESLPALRAYAEVLVGQLAADLRAAGLAAANVIVEVEQEDGKFLTAWGYLRPASSERGKLIDRANGLLERLSYSAGAIGLSISLSPLQPQYQVMRQVPLGDGNALTPDPLAHTLRTIRVRFGDGSIRDAAAASGPPPERVEVRVGEAGQPVSMVRDCRWSRVAQVQLHWRVEGDWWWEASGEAAGRKDYYQVVTRSGEILVLLHWEGRWYLDRAAKPSQWPV